MTVISSAMVNLTSPVVKAIQPFCNGSRKFLKLQGFRLTVEVRSAPHISKQNYVLYRSPNVAIREIQCLNIKPRFYRYHVSTIDNPIVRSLDIPGIPNISRIQALKDLKSVTNK